jgi:broad specificity phosphatase PhoE
LSVSTSHDVDRDLLEWNYGQYEGLRTAKIHAEPRAWQLFCDGCPGGESPDQLGARGDRVVGRVLAARWLGLEAAGGRFLLLSTANLSALGYEHNPSQPGHPTVGRRPSCGLVTRDSFRDMAVLAIAESWREKLVGAGQIRPLNQVLGTWNWARCWLSALSQNSRARQNLHSVMMVQRTT